MPTVSAPTHFGGDEAGEQDYAAQFAFMRSWSDVWIVAETGARGRRPGAPALELGAGTGIFSRPLVGATAVRPLLHHGHIP